MCWWQSGPLVFPLKTLYNNAEHLYIEINCPIKETCLKHPQTIPLPQPVEKTVFRKTGKVGAHWTAEMGSRVVTAGSRAIIEAVGRRSRIQKDILKVE